MINFVKKKDKDDKETRKEPKMAKQKINGERNIKLSKTVVQRIVSWSIIGLILLSLLFNVIFFSKYNSISSNVQAQQSEIEKELTQVEENEIHSSDKVIFYTEQFLREYINISADEEKRASQNEKLQTYFYDGFDVNELYNINDFNGSRTLKDMNYVERSVDENKIIDIIFEVTYDITSTPNLSDDDKAKMESEIKSKVEDDDDIDDDDVDDEVQKRLNKQIEEQTSTQEHTTLIRVPIMAVNSGYAVIDNPNEVDTELYANVKEDDVVEREYKGEEMTQSEISELDTTLNDFFTAYGQDDENVRLISNFDGGLGNKKLVEYDVLNAFSFNENDQSKVTAIVDVQYQDENTNLITTHNYTVTLLYYDGRYIVDDIK